MQLANGLEEGDEWEDVEEGLAEIIWQGNEKNVKQKKVEILKRSADQLSKEEDDDRPTSNPLPPQSAAFASHNKGQSLSEQRVLENVAQQIPNFGTEQDKAHCPFHLKTGDCRFGSCCSRVHFNPDKSCTLLIRNMYNGPGLAWEQDEGFEHDYADWLLHGASHFPAHPSEAMICRGQNFLASSTRWEKIKNPQQFRRTCKPIPDTVIP